MEIMERQLGILFLLISSLFGLEVVGENQKPTIEELHSKLASLAKLQYGNLLPHEILDQLYTHEDVNGEEHEPNTNSRPLINPANLLPHDLYNHAQVQSESGEESTEQNFENIQNLAVMQVSPKQTPARGEEEQEEGPMSSMSILDMEKSLMEEAGIMSLGDLEYDSENRQFEFLPQFKSTFFPGSDSPGEKETEETLIPGNQPKQQVKSSSSSENSLPENPETEAKGDITLELNPNGSDLEFIHANSNLKTVNSIPNFNAQIFTLSYGGEKRPVLIIQPAVENMKTKDMQPNQNVDKRNSSSEKNSISTSNSTSNSTLNSHNIEETSIPNFSIHFPLETNSQFQIPRYNFTLPTLFLPGLVFTQNENTKTNTHEIHVSVPQTNSMAGFLPPAPHVDNSQVVELLPFNPQESLHNSANINHQSNSESLVGQATSDKNPVVNITAQTEPEKSPRSETPNTNTNIQDKQQSPKPTLKSPPQNFQAFEKVHTRLFVSERTTSKLEMEMRECADQNKKSAHEVGLEESEIDEEDEATLCGSDGLCGVTCHRLGFHQGRCVDEDSCVCIFKQKPEFGLKIEFYVDKRARSWEMGIYPIHGFCHRSSCKINCEKAGYITGFCEESCFCGTPWAERTKRNETVQ